MTRRPVVPGPRAAVEQRADQLELATPADPAAGDDAPGPRRETLAEQVARRGELAALVDGPWRGCWYWRRELEAQIRAAREIHALGGTYELSSKCGYAPGSGWVPHPIEDKVRGRAWHWSAPAPPVEVAAVVPAQRGRARSVEVPARGSAPR